jgi:hypothetical protein
MSTNEKPAPPNPADSPWLWLAVFTFGAIVALVLMVPKFEGRQAQLERQYEARQAAGQSIRNDNNRPASDGELIITLKPLFSFFVCLLFALTVLFWIGRFRRQRRDSSDDGAIP